MSENYKHSDYFTSEGVPKFNHKWDKKVNIKIPVFSDKQHTKRKHEHLRGNSHGRVEVIDTRNGKIYSSVKELATELKMNYSSLLYKIKRGNDYHYKFNNEKKTK